MGDTAYPLTKVRLVVTSVHKPEPASEKRWVIDIFVASAPLSGMFFSVVDYRNHHLPGRLLPSSLPKRRGAPRYDLIYLSSVVTTISARRQVPFPRASNRTDDGNPAFQDFGGRLVMLSDDLSLQEPGQDVRDMGGSGLLEFYKHDGVGNEHERCFLAERYGSRKFADSLTFS